MTIYVILALILLVLALIIYMAMLRGTSQVLRANVERLQQGLDDEKAINAVLTKTIQGIADSVAIAKSVAVAKGKRQGR